MFGLLPNRWHHANKEFWWIADWSVVHVTSGFSNTGFVTNRWRQVLWCFSVDLFVCGLILHVDSTHWFFCWVFGEAAVYFSICSWLFGTFLARYRIDGTMPARMFDGLLTGRMWLVVSQMVLWRIDGARLLVFQCWLVCLWPDFARRQYFLILLVNVWRGSRLL